MAHGVFRIGIGVDFGCDVCHSHFMAWDYAKAAYQKQADADARWRLERLINYGLGKEKLDREMLKKYLPQLNIPADKRAFLELLLWNKPF